MAKLVISFFRRFRARYINPRGFFSLRAGVRRYSPPEFSYPSSKDVFIQDWHNIASDFDLAVRRLEVQFA